jgi:hypothetical protein
VGAAAALAPELRQPVRDVRHAVKSASVELTTSEPIAPPSFEQPPHAFNNKGFTTRTVETHAVHILRSLYLVETSLLLVVVGLYAGSTPFDATLLSTKAGGTFLAGALGLIASGWLLVRQTAAAGPLRARALEVALSINLLSVGAALLLSEAALRVIARKTPQGMAVRSVRVRPTWPELRTQSRQVLAAVTSWKTWDASYFIYDAELGWKVGPNRQSSNGLYFSSVEGLRSAGPDVHLADQGPAFRIALIGDSHAFSYEVPFADSWCHHLQRLLGHGVQVLNFGVDGYGIDQMYLHYLRDVRPWKPQVVVIGFSGHDLRRTMAVYPFVSFGWPGYIVKPRFTLRNGELTPVNLPLPTPDEVLTAPAVRELPSVEYDLGYATHKLCWRFDHSPLILRFLGSAFPRGGDPLVAEETTKALNSRLLTELARSIQQDEAVPIVVLMHSRNELVADTLSRARLSFLDMTECVTVVPADRRLVPSGNHYTGAANEAIARCTAPAVKLALRQAAGPGRDPFPPP